MAKDTVGKDSRDHYEGPDKPFYENSGGRLVASPSMGDDDGFGTPSAPGVRGEAYGGHVPTGRSTGDRSKVIDQFFSKKRSK